MKNEVDANNHRLVSYTDVPSLVACFVKQIGRILDKGNRRGRRCVSRVDVLRWTARMDDLDGRLGSMNFEDDDNDDRCRRRDA